MPYIRVDLDVRTDQRWLDAPPILRAGAKALYLDAVSYSGELLSDGHVPGSVMNGLAAELGLQRRHKIIDFLIASSYLARTKLGYFIPEWEQFHDSRETVQKRRALATKRQRSRRGQLQLGMSQRDEPRDVTAESQRDKERDSRARERTREVEAAAEDLDLTKAVVSEGSDEPDLGDATDPGDEPEIGPGANGTALDLTIEQIMPNLREMPL